MKSAFAVDWFHAYEKTFKQTLVRKPTFLPKLKISYAV